MQDFANEFTTADVHLWVIRVVYGLLARRLLYP